MYCTYFAWFNDTIFLSRYNLHSSKRNHVNRTSFYFLFSLELIINYWLIKEIIYIADKSSIINSRSSFGKIIQHSTLKFNISWVTLNYISHATFPTTAEHKYTQKLPTQSDSIYTTASFIFSLILNDIETKFIFYNLHHYSIIS